MVKKIDKTSLAYLGEDFQYKLIKEFMEAKDYFKSLASIIRQNMFATPEMRVLVGAMLDYHSKYNDVPGYTTLNSLLREKANTEYDAELYDGLIKKIRTMPSEGAEYTRDLGLRFFKMQNLYKVSEKIREIAIDGDIDNFYKCEAMLSEALNVGTQEDYEEAQLYDGIEETLSEDFRTTMPTGINKIDEILNGGLAKGELGVIIGSSGFGKTTITTSIALSAATSNTEQNGGNGFKVLQIVFEDRIKQIQRKHFSKITEIEACDLSKDEYIEQVKQALYSYDNRELANENLRIIRIQSGEKSVSFIRDIIKKHINAGFSPDIVIIDYFECLKMSGTSSMSNWEKEAFTMRKIESMANEFNIGVWTTVQGSRESISAELVTLDKGGGSIAKVQIAHIVMSITRSIEDQASNKATLSILKNRAGSSGIVLDNVLFNNGICKIEVDEMDEFGTEVEFVTHKEQKKDRTRQDALKDIFMEVKKESKKKQ